MTTSSQTLSQRPVLSSAAAASTSRDTRQPTGNTASSNRNRHAPEAITSSKAAPIARPPSVMGYPTQPPAGYASSSRPPPTQRPPSVYGATSSSKTRAEVSDSRNVFSKMFGRKTTPIPSQSEERGRETERDTRHRSSSRPPAPRSSSMQPPSSTNPLVRETSRDEWARQRARKEKEEKDREREKDSEREERKRAEYAAYKARQEEVARSAQAPMTRPATAAPRDRSVSRAAERAYESDAVHRRPQGSSRPEVSYNVTSLLNTAAYLPSSHRHGRPHSSYSHPRTLLLVKDPKTLRAVTRIILHKQHNLLSNRWQMYSHSYRRLIARTEWVCLYKSQTPANQPTRQTEPTTQLSDKLKSKPLTQSILRPQARQSAPLRILPHEARLGPRRAPRRSASASLPTQLSERGNGNE